MTPRLGLTRDAGYHLVGARRMKPQKGREWPRLPDKLTKTLRLKQRVATRVILWRIPHNTREDEISLKLGRYKISPDAGQVDELECGAPKSELTLDSEEFDALIAMLREHNEPFRQGVKAFIPLDRPFDRESATQIKALFALPERACVVKFIVDHDLIAEDLADGLSVMPNTMTEESPTSE